MLTRDTFGPAEDQPMAPRGGEHAPSYRRVLTPLGLYEDGLAGATLRALESTFSGFGHSPTTEMWTGLAAAAGVLEAMANGTADKVAYVSSLDPGVGKTQLLVHFLRELMRSPNHRAASAIICVNRKNQIRSIATDAQLDHFGVMTGDDELNVIGTAEPNKTRVLFTTQQMIEARCRNSHSFEAVTAFHYDDRPRMVRIWDEAMLPAEPITVSLDDLHTIPAELRGARPHFMKEFDKTLGLIAGSSEGQQVLLPDLPGRYELPERDAVRAMAGRSGRNERLPSRAVKAVKDVWPLFGRTVTVRRNHRVTILDYRESLPDDLKPVLVLDASARVRSTYGLWEAQRGGMRRLPSSTKNYAGLTIGVWDRAGGKDAFANDAPTIADGVAKTVATRPSEQWLVVHHKPTESYDLEKLVKDRLGAGADSVSFLTWGRHDATNEFASIPNVILAGVLFKPKAVYEATGRAAARFPSSSGEFAVTDEVQRGEHAHGILQALCRGSARHLRDGCCPASRAFIIAHQGSGIPAMLPDLFPGATVEEWLPVPKPLTGHAENAFQYLLARVDADASEIIPFGDVYRHLQMSKENFRKLRGHKHFRATLEAHGISETEGFNDLSPGFWHSFRYYFGDELD